MKTLWVALILAFGATAIAHGDSAYDPELGTVELHSHVFMDEGLGFIFNGNFNGPLKAKWSDRFSAAINPEALDRSGISILVASLYALPVFEFSVKDSIRKQIADAQKFVKDHPNWVLAHDPQEAAQILKDGKRVLILSLETAAGILDSEKAIQEFVDQDGIRIVTFEHLMDDDFGGAAYLRGYHELSDPFSWIFGTFDPVRKDGVRVNPRGLTAKGKDILQRLIAHHVWIDLSHSSDATLTEMVPIVQQAGQPLLYTHAPLRQYYGAERGITADQISAVKASGGIIGVVPSEDMLIDTKVDPMYCAKGCAPSSCAAGASALAEQYSETVALMGSADHVMFGSDFNGGIPHLQPGCGTHTSIDTEGLWNIGQSAEVWQAIKTLGAPVPSSPKGSREAFLGAWAKVMGGK